MKKIFTILILGAILMTNTNAQDLSKLTPWKERYSWLGPQEDLEISVLNNSRLYVRMYKKDAVPDGGHLPDEVHIEKIAEKGVNGFVYNKSTLENAKNILVLSFVQGKSGKLDVEKDDFATSKSNAWEMFDAGIACQTFCLAAHEKGVGTCIFGVIDDKAIAEIIGLPEDETVGTVITFGYPAETVEPTPRKDVSEIARFN